MVAAVVVLVDEGMVGVEAEGKVETYVVIVVVVVVLVIDGWWFGDGI